jgi:hypothetical protein
MAGDSSVTWRGALATLLLSALPAVATAQFQFSANVRDADRAFGSYAYAHEFGSGLYRFGERSIQIYRLPFGFDLRAADANGPAVRLTLPVTFGFVDFRPADIIDSEIPESIDALSVVPGVEALWDLGRGWRAGPYGKAGFSFTDTRETRAVLAGAGLIAEREQLTDRERRRFRSELNWSAVAFRDLPNDQFVRWRNAYRWGRSTPLGFRGVFVEAGGFVITDLFIDPPTGPTAASDLPAVQIEFGVMLDTRPRWRVARIPMPGIGLAYRIAGDFSGPRLVLGAPF